MRPRVLAAALALAATAALVPAASAYRVDGRAWPDGHIPYFNAAADQAWAVAQAVNAWNTSGARVRFVAVPRASARLVIRSTGSTSCTHAHATVGHTRAPTIWIWKRDVTSATCDPYWAAGALAHELGHVLGLGHEDRGCAAMNSRGNRRGPAACTPTERWQWRCRLLEHDDVLGAVALYGGGARAPRGEPACDLYAPIAAPRTTAVVDAERGTLQLAITRPPSPPLPAFLAADGRVESWTREWRAGACAATPGPRATRFRWSVPAGGRLEVVDRIPGDGAHCLSVWAFDGLGRPGPPARITVAG